MDEEVMTAGIVGARPPKGFDYELPIKIHKTRLCSVSRNSLRVRRLFRYLPDRRVNASSTKF